MEDEALVSGNPKNENSEELKILSTKEFRIVSTKPAKLMSEKSFAPFFIICIAIWIIVFNFIVHNLPSFVGTLIFDAFSTALVAMIAFAFCLRTVNGEAGQKENVVTLTKKSTEFILVGTLAEPTEITLEKSVQIVDGIPPESEPKTDEEMTIEIIQKKEIPVEPICSIGSVKINTFAEFSNAFDDFFEKRGMTTHLGARFGSLMMFSRFIILNGDQEVQSKAGLIPTLFGIQPFVISGEDCIKANSLSQDGALLQAFKAAEENPDAPIFLFVNNISSMELSKYLGDFVEYIKNPSKEITLTYEGSQIKVPSNIWFITCLASKSSVYDIDQSILPYIGILDFEYEKQEKTSNDILSIEFSIAKMKSLLTDEKHFLSEDKWKLFDTFIALFHAVNGYRVDNRVALRFEDALSAFLAINEDENAALDSILASSLLVSAISLSSPNQFQDGLNLANFIDVTFGKDQMIMCRKVIREYFALFDKEGNRIHE